MKPLTWLSARSRAQMIEMSHHGALPIHRFWPLRIQVSPSRFAVVGHAAACSRTHQRLGEAEAADLLEARHRRQPLLLLLLRPVEIDRAHRQAAVHAEEGAERSVDACHLHRDEAEQLLASARAAIALVSQAAEAQLLERRQQLERKRIVGPVLVDDRLDLGLHVRAHLLDDRLFLGGQDVHELVEVAVRRGELLRCFLHWCRCRRDGCRHCCCRCHVTAPLVPRQVSLFSRMTSYDPAVRAIPRTGDRAAMSTGDARKWRVSGRAASMAEKKAEPFQPQQARPRARDWHAVRFPWRPQHCSHPPHGSLHVRTSRIVLTFRRDPPKG